MNTKKVALYGGLGIAAVLLLLHFRANGGSLTGGGDESQFASPYLSTVPGIDYSLLNGGGAPFTSVINVGITADSGRYLDDRYMPLFGFAGMGVSGSLPSAINVTVNPAQVPAPPAPAVFSAPPTQPAPAPWVASTTRAPARQDGYYDMTGAAPRGLTGNLRGGTATSGAPMGGFGGF